MNTHTHAQPYGFPFLDHLEAVSTQIVNSVGSDHPAVFGGGPRKLTVVPTDKVAMCSSFREAGCISAILPTIAIAWRECRSTYIPAVCSVSNINLINCQETNGRCGL